MRKAILLLIVILIFTTSVSAMDISVPPYPESAEKYMPSDTESFGEGLWYIIKTALANLQPSMADAARICCSLVAVVLITTLLRTFKGPSDTTVSLVSSVMIGILLLTPSNALIKLGIATVEDLSEYGKLLLPVMTTAMAAQGSFTASAALYAGTALFNSILTAVIAKMVVPMLYIYMALCIANSVMQEDIIKNMVKFLKWLITWSLKIVLYVFTGYITVTGVVSGTADAAAVKAAKIAISGVVPVIGNIISDASETILVSASVMKSATGVVGLLVLLAVWIGPFLQIGVQYILLKLTAAVCDVFGNKQSVGLIKDFTASLGFVLAMIGTICLLHLVSTVCFMKGGT